METAVTLPFADGEYRFWLGLPQLVELERACGDTSILTLEERLRGSIGVEADDFVFAGGGAAMIRDVRHIIRLGLIGGNQAVIDGEQSEVGPIRAGQIIDAYVCPARPLEEAVVLAWRILHSVIYTVRLKKKATAKPETESPSTKAG